VTANDPFVRIPPPRPGCRATVVIPARNEAERIARTLGALAAQRDVDGGPLPRDVFDVLVYANNCDDATAEVARAAAGMHAAPAIHVAEEHLPANVAHIGTARRTAMEAAAARLRNANVPDAILAATDADTVPAPGWIAWTLREMERADAVTGRILIDPVEWAALPAHTRRMLLEENAYLYAVAQLEAQLDPKPYDPWPRHWQRSGPSFAVRVDAYEAAGGVPPVRALEDIALYEALERNGARIRHSLRVRVWTSARLRPRAPGGFGTRIRRWSMVHDAGAPLLVEDPALTVARLRGADVRAWDERPRVPAPEATAALRQVIADGGKAARATRNNVASIAG
jgi:cellulose synthase/poly-beta-1,6-N-acetylglucosamine synthase-like glycosyltransferase